MIPIANKNDEFPAPEGHQGRSGDDDKGELEKEKSRSRSPDRSSKEGGYRPVPQKKGYGVGSPDESAIIEIDGSRVHTARMLDQDSIN